MTKASDNPYPSLLIEEGTEPTAPPAGHQRVYIDSTTHTLHRVDENGDEVDIEDAGGGGGITRSTVGTTTVGGSDQGARGLYLKKVTLATDGLVASIAAHVKGNGTNECLLYPVIYADSGGSPTNIIHAAFPSVSAGTILSLRSMRLNTTYRWLTMPVGAWLTAADYWIGVWMRASVDSHVLMAYSSGTGADRTVAMSSTNTADDSSIQAISAGTHDHSFYANILR